MISGVVSAETRIKKSRRLVSPEQAAAAAMEAEARERGLALTGPDGLLKLRTKNVLETALHEEMTEHLGHEKNGAERGRESTNVRNGSRSKTVISDAVGEMEVALTAMLALPAWRGLAPHLHARDPCPNTYRVAI